MKTFKYISLLVLTISFFSCKQEEKVDYIILSGKAIVSKAYPYLMLRDNADHDTKITVNPDGTFLDTLRIKLGMHRVVTKGSSFFIYLAKGDNIVLEETGTNRQDAVVNISGDNAEFNNYLYFKNRKNKDYYASAEARTKLNEKAFLKLLDANQKELKDKLRAITNFPEALLKLELKDLSYVKNSRLYGYKRSKISIDTTFKGSETFEAAFTKVDPNDEDLYRYSENYRHAITGYIYRKSKELGVKYQKTILSSIENEFIRNEKLHMYAAKALRHETSKKPHYEFFMKHSTNATHKEEIATLYKEVGGLEQGQPSPKFVNYTNYTGGTTSLDDLKGKYVYIDVWATWCSPCKKEIPFLNKVEKKYHGKNIHFVSISIDNVKRDKAKWAAMIKDKNMGGIQLLADKEFKSDFVSAYKIGAIPRFLMLDPEGNIVTVNAPRPSDLKLIDFFTELGI